MKLTLIWLTAIAAKLSAVVGDHSVRGADRGLHMGGSYDDHGDMEMGGSGSWDDHGGMGGMNFSRGSHEDDGFRGDGGRGHHGFPGPHCLLSLNATEIKECLDNQLGSNVTATCATDSAISELETCLEANGFNGSFPMNPPDGFTGNASFHDGEMPDFNQPWSNCTDSIAQCLKSNLPDFNSSSSDFRHRMRGDCAECLLSTNLTAIRECIDRKFSSNITSECLTDSALADLQTCLKDSGFNETASMSMHDWGDEGHDRPPEGLMNCTASIATCIEQNIPGFNESYTNMSQGDATLTQDSALTASAGFNAGRKMSSLAMVTLVVGMLL